MPQIYKSYGFHDRFVGIELPSWLDTQARVHLKFTESEWLQFDISVRLALLGVIGAGQGLLLPLVAEGNTR